MVVAQDMMVVVVVAVLAATMVKAVMGQDLSMVVNFQAVLGECEHVYKQHASDGANSQ